ncbi:MAG: hypothetical protein AB1798_05025 [Spirochaetota bacterium]
MIFQSKKTLSKLLLAGVSLLILVSLPLFAGGEKEAAKKEPTLVWVHHYLGCITPEGDKKWEEELYKISGVRVKIIKPSQSEYNMKVASMLAAGDQVDLVYLDWGTYDNLIKDNPGLFERLDDRIKALKSSPIKASSLTVSGTTYAGRTDIFTAPNRSAAVSWPPAPFRS